MLTQLRIQNFKSWKDSGPIRLAPITLLFGGNSSGKSSIAQLLLMLKLTAQASDNKTIFQLGGAGDDQPFDLGSYAALLHQRQKTGEISIDIAWHASQPVWKGVKNHAGGYRDLSFGTTVGVHNGQPRVEKFHYSIRRQNGEPMTVGMKYDVARKSYAHVESELGLTRATGRQWPLDVPVKCYGFPDNFSIRYQDADHIRELNLAFEQLAQKIQYLGPLRDHAKRLYAWSGSEPSSVGYAGENTIPALLSNSGKALNFGGRKRYKPVAQLVAGALQTLGLIHAFEVKRISDIHEQYEVKIQVAKGAPAVNLPDVGCGLSQVLPVLTQCYTAAANSIILMEQPELHLHPKAQANLANVFTEVIRSNEERIGPRNIQLIIETHSEHLLRRLQRLVAEGVIKPGQVACYFIDQEKGESKLSELQVNEYGYITNWPKDFFGDLMGEAVAQQKAMIERRKNDTKGNFNGQPQNV